MCLSRSPSFPRTVRWRIAPTSGTRCCWYSATTHTFTAPNGTVFHHIAAYSGDVHIAPAAGEPSVEVPIDDLLAFVAHVVTERRLRDLREVVDGGELLARD